jgi:multidrug resistance efflux pump
MKPAFLLIPVLAVLGYFGYTAWRNRPVEGTLYGIVEARRVEAGSRIGGRVSAVFVEEGQLVEPGTPLVTFDFAEIESRRDVARARVAEAEARLLMLRRGLRPEEIAQAEAAAAQARAQLAALRSGPRPQEIEQARNELRAAEAEAAHAETNYRRVSALAGTGDIAKMHLDDATAKREATRGRREAIAQRLALLEAGTRAEDLAAAAERARQVEQAAALAKKGTRAEEIAQQEARLSQLRADLAQVEVQLAEGVVEAPARVRVEAIAVRPGDLVNGGRAVITLLEETQTFARVYVPETQMAGWKVGDAVRIRWDGDTNGARGEVQTIAAQAEFLPRNVQAPDDRSHQMFAMKVRILEQREKFKSGMALSVVKQ